MGVCYIKNDRRAYLFGFFDESERNLFRKLISVSGVGPSTAQVVLSTYSPDEIIHHITSGDVSAVCREPGTLANRCGY